MITAKAMRGLEERQLRNRLHRWPAFCLSSMLAYGLLPLDQKANTSKKNSVISQERASRNNTDYNADLWHVNENNRESVVETLSQLNNYIILCEYCKIVNCQTEARNSRKQFPSWERCDGHFPNRLWQKYDFYCVSLFAPKSQYRYYTVKEGFQKYYC